MESNKNSDTDAQGSWFMGSFYGGWTIKYWIYSTYDDHIGAFGKLHTLSDRQAIYLSKCSIPTHIITSTNGASYYIGNHFWEIWSYALTSQPAYQHSYHKCTKSLPGEVFNFPPCHHNDKGNWCMASFWPAGNCTCIINPYAGSKISHLFAVRNKDPILF